MTSGGRRRPQRVTRCSGQSRQARGSTLLLHLQPYSEGADGGLSGRKGDTKGGDGVIGSDVPKKGRHFTKII